MTTDNVTINDGSGSEKLATAEITHSGDTAHVEFVGLMGLTGSEGAWTAGVIPGDATNGLLVNLGANNDVTVTGAALTALQLIDDVVQVEDTNHGSGDAGVMALAVRNDALAALAGTDGDYAPLQVNASGALFIQEGAALDVSGATVTVDLGANNDVINAGTFAVQEDGAALTALQLIDDPVAVLGTATYTEASTKGMIVGAVRNDSLAALANTDNEIAPLQVTGDGALWVYNTANHVEDGVHASGDTGTFVLAVRNDTLAALAGADGDYAPLQVNASGALFIQEGTALDVSGATVTVDLGANNDVINTGTFAVQEDGAALTALQLIDNIVSTVDTGLGATPTGVLGLAIRDDALSALTPVEGDAIGLRVDANGALWTIPSGTVTVDATASGDVPITLAGETVVLGAGAASIGTLGANSGVDIGDVDVTTMPGTAAEAAALPSVFVVVAGDDGTDTHPLQLDGSGHLQVDIAADSVGIGGGTQYTEDDAAAANPVGNAVILVRDDVPGAQTTTDGDNVAQRGTDYGAAYVQVVTSSGSFVDSFGGSGGTAMNDDAAFTPATTQGTPAFAMFDDVTPDSVDEGDAGVLRMSANRNLYSTIRDAAGNERGANVDASNQLLVAEANSTAILADTANMDTNLGTIAGAVAGSEMQVDIVAVTPDLMLGTDFSTVMGTASLILATQADDVANTSDGLQTTAFGYAFDGTTWDRMRGDSTDGLLVNLGANNDISGTVTANLSATDNAVLDAIQAAVEIMDDWDETNRAAVNLVASQVGVAGGTGVDAANVLRVSLATDIALPAGTNAIGKLAANSGVDIGDVDILSIAAGSNLIGDVGIGVRTSGGTTIYYDNDLDETAVAVKASAGQIYAIHAINTTAAPLYLQLFNVAQGSVTVGTTTPTVQFVVPANADSDGAGFTFAVPQGIAFSTAITAAGTTNSEGNGAPAANALHCNIFYA